MRWRRRDHVLGFEERPDRVFSAILESAMEIAADLITGYVKSSGDDQQAWADCVLA